MWSELWPSEMPSASNDSLNCIGLHCTAGLPASSESVGKPSWLLSKVSRRLRPVLSSRSAAAAATVSWTSTSSLFAAVAPRGVAHALEGPENTPSAAAAAAARASAAAAAAAAAGEVQPCGPLPASRIRLAICALQDVSANIYVGIGIWQARDLCRK